MKKRLISISICLLLALTLWAPTQAASGTNYQTALKVTLDSIRATITEPESGSSGGEWAVLALARGGMENDAWYGKYMDSVIAKVTECNGVLSSKQYTEYSRVIIGLSAIGQDATKLNTGSKVYDLVTPLTKKQTNGEYWASWQGNNGTIFAIIALDSQNYLDDATGNETRAGLIDALLNAQLSSGAWEISSGSGADIDTTAMALQALAPYYLNKTKYNALGASHTYAQLQTSVTDALSYLNNKKSDNYSSVEAASQVVVALSALDRDAANDALLGNALDSVLSYYNGSGGFVHDHGSNSADQQMSTEQGAYALVAYDRWKNGKTSLYNMTDRPAVSTISVNATSAATVTQLSSGKISVSCTQACAVIAVLPDGTYYRLMSEGSGNTRTFHTVQSQVFVRIIGDYDGDGRVKTLDLANANKAMLGSGVSGLDALVMGAANGQPLKTINLANLNLKLVNGTSIDW